MKKLLFVITCFAIAGTQCIKAQSSIAALHHAGKVTLYNGSHLQTVINKALAGDTIYLSEGMFGGDVSIEKNRIVMIGTGERTILTGNVRISKDGVTISSCLLEGLNITGGYIWVGPVNGCTISQCQFREITGIKDDDNSDILLSRCLCKEEMNLNLLNHISVVNSKIAKITDYCKSASFSNCNIGTVTGWPWHYNSYDGSRVFMNCIINSWNTNAVATGCLLGPIRDGGLISYCYTIDEDVLNANLDCTISDLTDYIGTDGTVVGISGGDIPYTLVPSAPHVSNHIIEVDAENQKLNVTLTIEN